MHSEAWVTPAMLRFLPPTIRIALGLACVVVSLGLTGSSLGFLPQAAIADTAGRERVVTALAQRLLPTVSALDGAKAGDLLNDAKDLNPEIASIGVRQVNGEVFASTHGHVQHWLNLPRDAMPQSQMFAELLHGAKTWGRVEVRFRDPPAQMSLIGLPASFVMFLLYVGLASFVAFWFYLKRIVTELDPSQAVPERVQNAFDTMSEGVLVLDTSGNILLANSAICQKLGRKPEDLFGMRASALSWVVPEDGSSLPWEACLETGGDIRSVPISLMMTHGGRSNFIVNVTAIKDEGSRRGVIATFDDITELHETNQRLNQANVQLKKTQDEIKVQNEQLRVLASYDPLSGSLNRRAFFAEFDTSIRAVFDDGRSVACFMADIDHFKRINDTFGHATGDKVIAGMAETLRTVLRETDVIGRFGGEEFCVVLPDTDAQSAEELANRVRLELSARSVEWFDVPYEVTVSVGVAMMNPGKFEPADVVNRADEALYAAKTGGRNRVNVWQAKEEELAAVAEKPVAETAVTPIVPERQSVSEEDSAGPDVSEARSDAIYEGVEVSFDGDELTIIINDCVASLRDVAATLSEGDDDAEDANNEPKVQLG